MPKTTAMPITRKPTKPARKKVHPLVARARGILAGTIEPEIIVPPAVVTEFLDRYIAGRPVDPKVYKDLAQSMSFQVIYRGEMIAYWKMPNDEITVLASGWDNIKILLAGLRDDEEYKVVVSHTEPY